MISSYIYSKKSVFYVLVFIIYRSQLPFRKGQSVEETDQKIEDFFQLQVWSIVETATFLLDLTLLDLIISFTSFAHFRTMWSGSKTRSRDSSGTTPLLSPTSFGLSSLLTFSQRERGRRKGEIFLAHALIIAFKRQITCADFSARSRRLVQFPFFLGASSKLCSFQALIMLIQTI